MKLTDAQIEELNKLLKKSKLELPVNKRVVNKHTETYVWLQKNILVKNTGKVSKRVMELLDIS